jgi:ATP-dependent Clp protease ATP-binding subunit ClpA
MILTTNRITSLDIAVQSRIHLAIRYDDLTEQQRRNIFTMFLSQLREREPESIKDWDKVIDYVNEWGAENKLNGRNIRNVVSSALALARSQAKKRGGDDRLTDKDLKDVMRITKDFQNQLEAITTRARSENEAREGK